MAKASSKKPLKADWKGFHNVNLSSADELLFEAWQSENVVGLNWAEHWTDNGYKFSIDFDPYHEGYRASLYCTQAKMEWAGYTMSAWGEDLQTAINLLAFKHHVMCQERWEIAKDKPNKGTSKYG